jgi:L-fuconate dehydratase
LITEQEALAILKKRAAGKKEREKDLIQKGYPAYTTATGLLKIFY